MNQGYIDSVESEMDRRCKIYYPTGIMTKNRKLFDNNSSNNYIDGKSKITVNHALFPHREYIISQIHGVLKYSETGGGSVRIQDHEGKDLTVEELVNIYYENPSVYFDLEGKEMDVYRDNNDNLGSFADTSQKYKESMDIKKSREDIVMDQINKMFSEYDENGDITKELEDISKS